MDGHGEKMNKLIITSAILLSVTSVHAAENVQWDKASASFVTAKEGIIDLSGFAFSGSKLLDESIFVQGRIESTSDYVSVDDVNLDIELSRFTAGLGYRHAISNTADVFGLVSYENFEVTASVPVDGLTISVGERISGMSFEFGLRAHLNANIEAGASLKHWRMDLNDGENGTETNLNFYADYHFNDQYSIGLSRSKVSDLTITDIKATVYF